MATTAATAAANTNAMAIDGDNGCSCSRQHQHNSDNDDGNDNYHCQQTPLSVMTSKREGGRTRCVRSVFYFILLLSTESPQFRHQGHNDMRRRVLPSLSCPSHHTPTTNIRGCCRSHCPWRQQLQLQLPMRRRRTVMAAVAAANMKDNDDGAGAGRTLYARIFYFIFILTTDYRPYPPPLSRTKCETERSATSPHDDTSCGHERG